MKWCETCGKPVTDYEALHEVFNEGDSLGDKYIEHHCPECGDTLSVPTGAAAERGKATRKAGAQSVPVPQ